MHVRQDKAWTMTNSSPAGTATGSHWPKAGASFILFRGDSVLLVERAKAPRAGLWSLPGGHIEAGETASAAACRELLEETGITATAAGLVDIQDVIIRDDAGTVTAHYLLAVFYGPWRHGEPVPASDARSARFVALDRLDDYPLTSGAKRLIALAARKIAVAP
jgi:8-oxo-dGTP diphosphatase